VRVVVGISGASGTVYGQRLVARLVEEGAQVFLTMSRTLGRLFPAEIGLPCDVDRPDLDALFGAKAASRIAYRAPDDVSADIASGSFPVDATVVCPVSTGCLGRLASGASTNLLERACDVALKEGRTLVLVPRETPLSTIHLRAMLALAEAGATILPASPGFYHRPTSVEDLVEFVVQRVLDRIGIRSERARRWQGPPA
jgi:4-hydroxy-3-polyprenylbenzoate decarboxylase